MRWVEAAAMRPHHCAAIPFSGMHSPGGFIDTGVDLPGWDPHVYVSVQWIAEAVKFLGWPEPQDVQALRSEVASRDAELEQLRAEVAEKDQQLAAIEVLKNNGFQQAKRPGRKKAVT